MQRCHSLWEQKQNKKQNINYRSNKEEPSDLTTVKFERRRRSRWCHLDVFLPGSHSDERFINRTQLTHTHYICTPVKKSHKFALGKYCKYKKAQTEPKSPSAHTALTVYSGFSGIMVAMRLNSAIIWNNRRYFWNNGTDHWPLLVPECLRLSR